MWITVLIFAVAAMVGLSMALAVFQGRFPPIASAITHGVLVATGLVLLIVAVCRGATGAARWALGFFLVAALGGFTLVFAYHARRKNLPANFVVGHATLAVIGLLLLLAGALHLI
jgi:predicted membrane channel-forming protein YqfA (hemolysin III family)